MQFLNPQPQKYTIFWHIVFVLHCSTNNEHGNKYFKKLSFDKICKDEYFSFLHKPFQKKVSTCLINPSSSNYSLEIQNCLLKKDNQFVEEARITCTGKALTDGLLDNYLLPTNMGLLEQTIIAVIKEHVVDNNYENLLQHVPLYISSSNHQTVSCQDSVKKTMKKELSYAGFQTPNNKEDDQVLKRHFPSLLIEKAHGFSLAKRLYLQLLEPSLSFSNSTYSRDKHAAVNCEKFDFTVHVQESDQKYIIT
jgi:hypothetical protein